MVNSCETCGIIGRKALDLIKLLPAKFPEIDYFYFKTYEPHAGVEERLRMKEVRTLASVSTGQLLDRFKSTFIVEQLLKGVDADESKAGIEVRTVDLPSKLVKLELASQADHTALALYSMCRDSSGNEWHIPMMDFRIESSTDARQIDVMTEALKKLDQIDGVLLDTGRSYHYYGFKLLTHGEWVRFMAACLLLEPFVDVRYIAHRALAEKAALRLTVAPTKDKEPQVVACLQHGLR